MSPQYDLNGSPRCKKKNECGSVRLHGKGKFFEEAKATLEKIKDEYPCINISINGEKIPAKRLEFETVKE